MDIWGWVGVLISSGLAVLALRRVSLLRKEVDRLIRNEGNREGKMREISEVGKEALEITRIQLGQLATGKVVAEDLIRSGRLYRDITPDGLVPLLTSSSLSTGDIYVLDVRTLREFAVKHLPSAKSIPLEELGNRCDAEIPEKNKTLIVYCATGDRSQLACEFLTRRGFTTVHHLKGGLQQWSGPTEGMGNMPLIQIQSRSKVHH